MTIVMYLPHTSVLSTKAKVACFNQIDWVNCGKNVVDFWLMLQSNHPDPRKEQDVREVLLSLFDLAEHWTLRCVSYNPIRNCVEVVVEHPSFEEVQPGYEYERLLRKGEICSTGL